MEIAVVNPQALLQPSLSLQMYPWPITSSPLTDKETIIANADFTTTSAIARRRLSNKKRRKPAADASVSGGDSSSCSDGSASSSPTGSLDSLPHPSHPSHPSHSPPPATTCTATTTVSASTTTTQTPPPLESTASLPRSLADLPTTTLSTHQPSHTHTHQVIPSHPCATAGTHGSVSLVPATYQFAPSLPLGSTTHPMYPHLQQELNYRYLQDQSGPGSVRHGNQTTAAFSVPQSQPSASQQHMTAASASVSSEGCGRPQRVKWCTAHITIAKQILSHQQQAKNVLEAVSSSAAVTTETGVNNKPHPSISTAAATTTSTAAALDPAQQHPTLDHTLDPAQQLALLQMYGVPTTTIPGYMAIPAAGIPYSTMPAEVQLQNMSFVPHTAQTTALFMDASNVLSIKPVPGTTTQASDASHHHHRSNLQMINLLPYTQSLPVAAVMPNGTGMNTGGGSYVGHVPVPVIGNCVLNPCHPGVMATPWVR